ncbi:hypothetical protein GWK47_036961 [Chionoecetes opilio]|uniref:Uncharacterized protein n=1 Tax=Chionoecetes opilio TaxID=41210 RepID=A0A8J4YGU9_CHIOP|nr:hypothetical protein GWK47_036961 [Chionoecetes opilio]
MAADFTLKEAEASPACVRVEPKQQKLRLLLYRGTVDHGELMDYTLDGVAGAATTPGKSLGVAVRDNLVVMWTRTTAAPYAPSPKSYLPARPRPLRGGGPGLWRPHGGVCSRAAASPPLRTSRSTDTRMNLHDALRGEGVLYFLPGATLRQAGVRGCAGITPPRPRGLPFIAGIRGARAVSRGQSVTLVTLPPLQLGTRSLRSLKTGS